jgi:hypothetical protein
VFVHNRASLHIDMVLLSNPLLIDFAEALTFDGI